MSGHDWKEYPDAQRFAQMLRQCADAIEHGVESEMQVDGQPFVLGTPEEMKVEYEMKKNKHELELTLEWRSAA